MRSFLWFFAGIIVGAINALSLVWTVGQAGKDAGGLAAVAMLGGFLLRMVLITGIFILALQRGISAALWAFAGLILVRVGLVVAANSGKIDWRRFKKQNEEEA